MPDIVVRKRNRPISSLAEMTYGSMSNDNNNFTHTFSEYHALRSAHEEDAAILHRSVGGNEFVKGIFRAAIYVDDSASLTEQQFERFSPVFDRVQMYRSHSPRDATKKLAATPWLFAERSDVTPWFPPAGIRADRKSVV